MAAEFLTVLSEAGRNGVRASKQRGKITATSNSVIRRVKMMGKNQLYAVYKKHTENTMKR